jgi:hypothetical protein
MKKGTALNSPIAVVKDAGLAPAPALNGGAVGIAPAPTPALNGGAVNIAPAPTPAPNQFTTFSSFKSFAGVYEYASTIKDVRPEGPSVRTKSLFIRFMDMVERDAEFSGMSTNAFLQLMDAKRAMKGNPAIGNTIKRTFLVNKHNGQSSTVMDGWMDGWWTREGA